MDMQTFLPLIIVNPMESDGIYLDARSSQVWSKSEWLALICGIYVSP